MRDRFCPKCGRKGIETDICDSCNAKEMHKEGFQQEIVLKVCHHCRRYHRKGKWIALRNPRSVITRTVTDNFKDTSKVKIESARGLISQKRGEIIKEDVDVIATTETKTYPITVKIRSFPCENCSRIGTKYFEGIMQLRQPTQEVVEYIDNELEKTKKRGFYATMRKEVTNGIDYYLSSKRHMRNFAISLQKRFGGSLKISSQLFTQNRQTSKDVFRVNVYFEPLPYKIGEVILFEGRLLKILKRGKQIVCLDLEKNKNSILYSKQLLEENAKNVKKIGSIQAKVIKILPAVEILHPETYQPVKIENAHLAHAQKDKKLVIGEKIKIVVHNGKAWMV